MLTKEGDRSGFAGLGLDATRFGCVPQVSLPQDWVGYRYLLVGLPSFPLPSRG